MQNPTVWLLGGNTAASRSPEIHAAIYDRLGLPWHYALCSLNGTGPEEMLRCLWRRRAVGCNITAPFKEQAYRYLRKQTDGSIRLRLSPQAQRLGSVNTVKFSAEGMYGCSTDGPGWWRAFSEEFAVKSLSGRTVLLLGAGGAARALLDVLLQHGAARVWVVNRTPERARNMLKDLDHQQRCSYIGPRWQGTLPEGTVVVQTTPCRSAEELSAFFAWQSPPPGVIACDILYGDCPSAFIRQAEALGLPRQDGLGMLRCQAELAVSVWNGADT